MKFAKFLSSFWGILSFILIDIVLFLGFSYDELHWYLVNPEGIADWAIQQGISVIVGTFIAMMIGFILPYLVYFSLLNRELTVKETSLSNVIFMTVIFIVVKLVILSVLTFFNYVVRYL